jgi:hypothetical protein
MLRDLMKVMLELYVLFQKSHGVYYLVHGIQQLKFGTLEMEIVFLR